MPLARDAAADAKVNRAVCAGLGQALHGCLGDALFDSKSTDPLRALVL